MTFQGAGVQLALLIAVNDTGHAANSATLAVFINVRAPVPRTMTLLCPVGRARVHPPLRAQVTNVNDPPRLSDALLAANATIPALENLLHQSHPAPSRLLSVRRAEGVNGVCMYNPS